MVHIPSELHLLKKSISSGLPGGLIPRHAGFIAVIETVIFQFLLNFNSQILKESKDLKRSRGHFLLCSVLFLSLSVQLCFIAISWINSSLAAVSAVAVFTLKPTIYQHSGSTSLSGQLTSSRLMSC